MAARKWTLEQRKMQSKRIQKWKPWEASTGPKSEEGKQAVSKNAKYKKYQDLDEFLFALNEKLKHGGPRIAFTGYHLLDVAGYKKFRRGMKKRAMRLPAGAFQQVKR